MLFTPSTKSLRPEGIVENGLQAVSHLPGWLGWVAYRKLKRRIGIRTMNDFNKVVETLGPGDICCDLGANIGEVTRILAATGATVHAFEPDPETFAKLQKNLEGFANVHCHNQAVGHENSTVTLLRTESYSNETLRASASKATAVVPRKNSQGFVESGTVEMIDFSEFLQGLEKPAALVKVDIEGAEWTLLERVLTAASDRFKAMFVETHERFDLSILPYAKSKQAQFRNMDAPYINLYWG